MKRAGQHIEWINNPGYFKSVNPLLKKHKNILPSRSATPVCHHSIRAGPPSWVASANHQFPNLAGTGEKGNLPIWKIYRFLIDSDSRFLLLVTSAPLVTFFNPCCQLFPIVCNQKDNDIIPFLISSRHLKLNKKILMMVKEPNQKSIKQRKYLDWGKIQLSIDFWIKSQL